MASYRLVKLRMASHAPDRLDQYPEPTWMSDTDAILVIPPEFDVTSWVVPPPNITSSAYQVRAFANQIADSRGQAEDQWLKWLDIPKRKAPHSIVNPYAPITLDLIKWGAAAFILSAITMLAAFVAKMPLLAAVSLLALFVSTVLIGEAQRRAKLERSRKEGSRV